MQYKLVVALVTHTHHVTCGQLEGVVETTAVQRHPFNFGMASDNALRDGNYYQRILHIGQFS